MTKTIMILVIAAAFVAGTLTTATIVTAQNDTIIACVNNKSQGKDLRIVDSADDCRNNETPLEWNKQGIQGEKGDTGDAGADGMDGAPGQGLSCENQIILFQSVPGFIVDPSCIEPLTIDMVDEFSYFGVPISTSPCDSQINFQVNGGISPISKVVTVVSGTVQIGSVGNTFMQYSWNPASLPAEAVLKLTATDALGTIAEDTINLTCLSP